MDNVYNLASGVYIEQLNTVDNLFIRQLYALSLKAAQQNKMLDIVSNNVSDSNTDLAKNIKQQDSSVLNICTLPPLVDKDNCNNLVEDIAKFRWEGLSFRYDKDYWRERQNLLFLDYMLSSCFCYVEIFDPSSSKKGSGVDKFYATRNRYIASLVAKVDNAETAKYVNYLTPVLADYKMGRLRILKLAHQKKGYKITQPRSAIDFNKPVKVTPVFFIDTFIQGMIPLLKENMVKFTYIKDNGQKRELITTLSKTIFEKYYGESYAEDIVSKFELKIDRGYIKVPELGCSRYDESGLRALNISRIIGIEVVQEFDTRYIDVDFNSIIPTFTATIGAIRNEEAIKILYNALMGKEAEDKGINDLKSEITAYVDGRFAIGTSTFQKELHNFMMKYYMIFKGYTGKPMKFDTTETFDTNSFNLGFE